MSTTRCRKLLRVDVYANTSTTAFHTAGRTIRAYISAGNGQGHSRQSELTRINRVYPCLLVMSMVSMGISLQFPRYSKILAENCEFLSHIFTAPLRGYPWNFVTMNGLKKRRPKQLIQLIFSINGRTDRQTDTATASTALTRVKNSLHVAWAGSL